tara:strand:- start:63 stop:482 length:420 start_codon:yes stop_codon:yes gene_type:complete
MFGMKLKYTKKFYLGIGFFLISFVFGGVSKLTFFLYVWNPWIRWSSVIVYVVSWVMLILGIWWVGEEYADAVKKYFTYRYYHRSIKHGTTKVIKKTAAGTKVVAGKVKGKSLEVHSRVKERIKKSGRRNKKNNPKGTAK